MQDQENNHNPLDQPELVDGDNRTSVDGLLSVPTSNQKGGKKTTRFNLPPEAVTTTSTNVANGGMEITVEFSEKKSSSSSIYGLSVIRKASSNLKRLAPSANTRRSVQTRFDRTKSAAVDALKGLKFIGGRTDDSDSAWAAVARRFDDLTKETDGMLPRSLFGKCIGMDKKSDQAFACLLFDTLGRRLYISRDSITKEQLQLEYWDQIADPSFVSRLQIFFDMVDKDSDGRISEDEVREMIALSASANGLTSIQKRADEYARLIMEELDPDGVGCILIDNLQTLLLQGASSQSQTVGASGPGENQNLSKMIGGKLKPTKEKWHRNIEYFLENNWPRVWVMALWVGAMAGLFAYKYVQYKNRAVFNVMGHCVCMAKGAAETLKLNMALILFPVCRNTITWLRNKTKLGVAVPFDDNLNFHKMIATAIALGVGIHGISHLACDFPRLLNASPEKYAPMERFFGDQPTSYWFFVKGWEGVTGIVMVVVMAISFTLAFPWFRKGGVKLPKPLDKLTGFNSFWYSHHLFIIVYALLIIHGIKLYLIHKWYKKTTWMYLAIPILLYAGERFTRTFRSNIKAVEIRKMKATVYKTATALHMPKPGNFEYRSGQYIFVKCSAVSPFEWHPFSITSAPTDDYLSVHIRALGDWTKEIRDVFYKVCQPPPAGETGIDDFVQSEDNPKFPKLSIDGPYGAPTQHYKEYEVVLLVGLGIGATPMISVVKDILYNITAIEKEANALEEGARANALLTSSSPESKAGSGNDHHSFKIKKAYFYWMTREQDSFDWFKNVMNEVAEKDRNGVIEIHNHCTSVYKEGDARSALIAGLQALYYAKNGVDVISGTRVKSHFARPDWKAVFNTIAFKHPGATVGVFYCGDPPPVKELKQLSSDDYTTFTKFKFHKENF